MEKFNSIYIVDDDPITVFGIRKIINSIVVCKKIETFGNGKLAIESVRKVFEDDNEFPEVIFLDINMPVMDGWQFLAEFIQLPISKKVRINVITSSIDSADYESWLFYKARTHHIVNYVNKPIQRSELIEITKPVKST